jgi:hypothetical protein
MKIARMHRSSRTWKGSFLRAGFRGAEALIAVTTADAASEERRPLDLVRVIIAKEVMMQLVTTIRGLRRENIEYRERKLYQRGFGDHL